MARPPLHVRVAEVDGAAAPVVTVDNAATADAAATAPLTARDVAAAAIATLAGDGADADDVRDRAKQVTLWVTALSGALSRTPSAAHASVGH